MTVVGSLLQALAATYGAGVAARFLRWRGRSQLANVATWCFVPIVLACPLLIPSAAVGWRALAATISGDIALKLVDYFRRCARGNGGTGFREFCQQLIPLPVFGVVYPDHRRRVCRREAVGPQLLPLVLGIAGVVGAVVALKGFSGSVLIRSSFALNHVAMLLTFVVAIESLARALCAIERLAGFDTVPLVRNAYQARTVSEFWRRYNYRIHDWLYRNVFLRSGGRHAPVRAVVSVFVVSGAFHELMFAVATSRFTGYQFAFFALQAPAVLASGRVERLAKHGGRAGRIFAHGLTLLFLAVTSVLFFDGVHMVFPFIYVSRSPLP